MGQLLSKNKKKVEELSKQLRDAQAKRDEDLKAKDRELQAVKEQNSKTAKETDELRKKTQLLEARSSDLEKQNQEQLNGLQSSLKRNGEDADKQRRDMEAKVASLTKERDQAQSECDNHEIRSRAAEYSQKRHKKELEDARETAKQEASQSTSSQREVLDQRRRDLEAQTLMLTQQRDQAQSERDTHELRGKAAEYAHKREKKAAAEASQTETAGVRQAHEALLQYHDNAKKDWTGLLLQAQYENGSLRLQKQALHKSYDDAYALRYENDALRLQKKALHGAYNDISGSPKAHEALLLYHENTKKDYRDLLRQAQLENEALRLQKQALVQAYEGKKDVEKELRGAQYEITAVRNTNSALVEYHRKKGLDANAKYASAQEEIAASRSLHKDLSDYHGLTQKQLAAARSELATSQQQHAQVKGLHERLQKDSAERFSKQQGQLEAERATQTAMRKEHEDAVKRLGLDHAAQIDKAKQAATSAQNEKTSLESKIKQLETEKEAHIQTQVGLSDQLSEAKAKAARLEQDSLVRHDSATNGMKIDSPQEQSVHYNVNNM